MSAGGMSAGGMSAGGYSGGGKKKTPSERSKIVSQVMKEHHLNLAQASKYVKEHGLYKRGGLLSIANLDDMKGDTGPQPYSTGASSVCRRGQLIRQNNLIIFAN
jgi:hypothetical protein